MDQKLLDALNNLSFALEEISNALKDKSGNKGNSPVSNALASGDVADKINAIDEGVKQLVKDNKEILKNQQTIIEMGKKKSNEKSKLFESSADNKQKIKDGATTILLIAGAVLAIGLAFSILGSVNFATVFALSIAIPVMALTFEHLAKNKELTPANTLRISGVLVIMSLAMTASSWILSGMSSLSGGQLLTMVMIAASFATLSYSLDKLVKGTKDINPKDLWKLPLVLIAASAAITMSSWILKGVIPIGIFQLITVVMIAGAFAALSYSLDKLAKGISSVDPKDLWKLPLVLIAASTAITVSSWILKGVVPIGLFQALTAIMIAGTFAVISYGIAKIMDGLKKADLTKIALMPLVLIATSFAIMKSSEYFRNIQVISFGQFLTAVGISIAFIPMAFALGLITKAIKDVKPTDVVKIGLTMVGMVGLIYVTSLVFNKIQPIPIGKLISITLMSISLSIIGVVMGLSMMLLSKIGIDNIIKGGLAMVIIATSLSISSHIISKGNYTKYPPLMWTLGTAVSLVAFGIGAFILGLIATSGIGGVAMLAGAGVMIGLATAIVGVSHILGTGNYTKYPTLNWALGVGASMVGFGLAAGVLGAIVLTGIGAVALAAGVGAILLMAKSIVEVAGILGRGNYGKFPSSSWALGVSNSLSLFGRTLSKIGLKGVLLNGIGKLLGGGPVDLAKQMLAVDNIFKSGSFKTYPSELWAKGVSLAISAFGGILGGEGFLKGLGNVALNAIGDLLGGGPVDLAKKMIEVDKILSTGSFTKFPSIMWTSGVIGALKGFVDIGGFFSAAGEAILGFFGVDSGPTKIANDIIKVDQILSKGNFAKFPTLTWIGGTVAAINGITKLTNIKSLSDDLLKSLFATANQILQVDKTFSQGNFKVYPTEGWIKGVSETFNNISKLSITGGIGADISKMSSDITKLANAYSKLGDSIKTLSNGIQTIDADKLMAINQLTGTVVMMSLMDSNMFNDMMNKLGEKTSVLNDVIKNLNANKGGGAETPSLSGARLGGAQQTQGGDMSQVLGVLNSMDQKLGVIAQGSQTLSDYLSEIRGGSSNISISGGLNF